MTTEIILSKPLPVAGQPVDIVLANGDDSAEITFTIETETGDAIAADVSAITTDEGPGVRFTPPDTGYYTVRATGPDGTAAGEPKRFPVVHRDLHFLLWPPVNPEETGLRLFGTVVVVKEAARNPDLVRHWRRRGAKVLGEAHTKVRRIDLAHSGEQNVRMLLDGWCAAAEGADGIYIDELSGFPNEAGHRKARIMSEALKRFRDKYPQALLYVAVAGAPLPELACGIRIAGGIGILEVYQQWIVSAFGAHRFYDYIDQRIQVARHTDLLHEPGKRHGALIYIGMDGLHGAITKGELEDSVRYIKKQAPEMPGIAFYASSRTEQWLADTGMRAFGEELCERYYVRPVIDLGDLWLEQTAPRTGEPNKVHLRVHNLGGMRAREVEIDLFATCAATGEREQVGTVSLATIGTGHDELIDPSLERTAYRSEKIDGLDVPVFSYKGVVFRDRVLASFDWTPRAAGAHTLQAVLRPKPGVTMLDGVRERQVVVGTT